MTIDDPLKSLVEVMHPDPRRSNIVGTLQDEHDDLASIRLNDGVPLVVAQLFETAKNVSLYSWFVYRFHPVSELVAFSALELALNLRKAGLPANMAASQNPEVMADQVLIPLPGIGTLSLTRAEYDAALIPIAKPEVPKPVQPKRPEPPAPMTTETASKPRGLRYLRLRDVCERVGVGTSTIYKMMATGAFPRQVKLSLRTAAWIESEVEAFMIARIAARDQPELTPEDSPYLRMGEVMRLTGMTHAMI